MSHRVTQGLRLQIIRTNYLFAPKEGVHAPRRKSSFRRVQKLKLTVHRKINIFIVRPYSRNYLHLDHMNCKIPEDQLEDRFFKWGEGFLNLLLWDPFEGARPRLSVPVEKGNAARLYHIYSKSNAFRLVKAFQRQIVGRTPKLDQNVKFFHKLAFRRDFHRKPVVRR
ncbi:unnamed protein product [Nesidiocoris tenuis]|uniref:Uncharacterized protein n=1 Tax=Nesidiocoris tenuis TaxID=355587 RepID=A0A6H5GTY4_9HEMI|nr:unnamed protein product [Nesidiocoris tenuis]